MINLAFLVQLGMSTAFIDKFLYLVEHLTDSRGYIDADTPFKLDSRAEKWIMDNITVNEEILNYGEEEAEHNGKVIKLF